MSLLASLPLKEDDFNTTPPAVQALVLAQREEILLLREQVSALQKEISALREQVSKNSKNSSLPPSSDPPSVEKPKRPSSGRKPGGQPGHQGGYRTLKPPDEVKEVISVKPSTCKKCSHELSGDDSTPLRHQVTDIPPLVAETIEYQLHTLLCSQCGTQTRAELPKDVPCSAFGPRICAMVAALSGQYHLSKRQIEEMLCDFFGVDIGLDTVHALEQGISEALKAPVAEVADAIQQQPVANVDETSWKEGDKKSWLWVVVTPIATLFLLRLSRGAQVAVELISETFSGIVGSDRWSGYSWINHPGILVYIPHPIQPGESFPVIVGGQVTLPGTYLATRETRLMTMIFLARGFAKEARLDDVKIIRVSDKGVTTPLSFDITQFVRSGVIESNPLLSKGDTIFVPISTSAKHIPPIQTPFVKSMNVNIIGEVRNGGIYQVSDKVTILDMMILAGGFTREANLERVVVIRGTGDEQKWIEFDFTVVRTEGRFDLMPELADGDTVFIPQRDLEPSLWRQVVSLARDATTIALLVTILIRGQR